MTIPQDAGLVPVEQPRAEHLRELSDPPGPLAKSSCSPGLPHSTTPVALTGHRRPPIPEANDK